MKRFSIFLAFLSFAFSSPAFGQETLSPAEIHIANEVRHELLMVPWFGVFDNITFRVNGNNVILQGEVTRGSVKADAEKAVKHIQGVEGVTNNIEVLPPSPMDDQLRRNLYRVIYGDPGLEKYALGMQKPIRIIVKSGHVSLEGVVDNEGDKNMVNIRARGVPGIFSVANNLRVVPN